MGFFTRSKKKQSPENPQYMIDKSIPAPSQSQVPQQWNPHDRPRQTVGPGKPAGYLHPPPSTWNNTLPLSSTSPPQYHNSHNQQQYAPIVVNQYYYGPSNAHPPHSLAAPYPYSNGACAASRLKLGPVANLANDLIPGNIAHQVLNDGLPPWHAYGTQLLNQSAAMFDQIYSNFNNVMTLIDRDKYIGDENDLFVYQPNSTPTPPSELQQQVILPKGHAKKSNKKETSKGQAAAIASSLASRGHFAKVELYANSKLPLNLSSANISIHKYPLICLAAKYSERVYESPRGDERDFHVDADWRTGAKAMRIKTVPIDDMNTIVFAIRGTATFMDWSVNLNTNPTAPTGFLDDENNLCHAGFLSVARKMIPQIAARLRQFLEEDSQRKCESYSLLLTGHSAGGAIAALLYAHMLSTSTTASSELNHLRNCFQKIHCITFGAPPVSLSPLQTPTKSRFRNSTFLSFINEGDPVARADKAYVKSLLELFVAPAPTDSKGPPTKPPPSKGSSSKHSKTHGNHSSTSLTSKTSKTSAKSSRSSSHSSSKSSKPKPSGPIWKVPESSLSNAGEIVVLRSGDLNPKFRRTKTVEKRLSEGVIAQRASDEQLRGQIWGDPVCHVMKLYSGRVKQLAVDAVTAKGH